MDLDFYIKKAKDFREEEDSSGMTCEDGFCSIPSIKPMDSKFRVTTVEELYNTLSLIISVYGRDILVKTPELVNSDYKDEEEYRDITVEVLKPPKHKDEFIVIIS